MTRQSQATLDKHKPNEGFDRDVFAEKLSPFWRVIPRQIPLYWLEGQFNLAQYRSDRYNKLGWSLLVRGIYWYQVTRETDVMHGGIALIDFEEISENLTISGLRVIGHESCPEVAFWKSTMCKLDAKPTFSSLQFAYSREDLSPDCPPPELRSAPSNALGKDIFNLAKAISIRRQTLNRSAVPETFMESSEAFVIYEALRILNSESREIPTLSKYALVICERIQDQDTPQVAFSFGGRYLRTEGSIAEDKINFSRLL